MAVSGLMNSKVCSKMNLPTSAKKKWQINHCATTTKVIKKGQLALTAIHQDETCDGKQIFDRVFYPIILQI